VNTMVQVAVAGDVGEAEEIQAILTNVGIDSQLSTPEDDADAVTVLVPETDLETALDAIEALTEPDDLVGEA
jgi:type III secretory pathway lipoprotein EscJ